MFVTYTGRILRLGSIKEFPIPRRVVRRMNDWGKKSKIKEYEIKAQISKQKKR